MEWGTPVWWGWFLLFSRSGGHKTKETYPTRPGSPTPCKQGLRVFGTRKWPIIQSHYKIQFDTTRPPSLKWSIEHCVLTPHPRGVLFVDNLSRPTPWLIQILPLFKTRAYAVYLARITCGFEGLDIGLAATRNNRI